MQIIRSDSISYTYPVMEQVDDYDGRTSVNKEATAQAEPVLKDVSLTVEPGQFICILGHNGSGKSTFARHLNGLLTPDSGTLWIDGMDTKDEEKIWQIRSAVGMVFQNPDNQIIGTVVDEDVAFGPENLGVPSEEIIKRVDKSLETVAMTRYKSHSPNKLSGGQKQRVAIAGILAMNPKCIVLDEATAMLDPRGRDEVMGTVRRLNEEQNITVISITHYMDEALMADKVFVMSGGRVLMAGTPKEIFSRPQELMDLHLTLPPICQLAWDLKCAGLDIPEGITDEAELKEALLKLKKK